MKQIFSLLLLCTIFAFYGCSDNYISEEETTDTYIVQERGPQPIFDATACTYTMLYTGSDYNGLDANGDPCDMDVTFYFVSETGEEYSVEYNPATDPPPSITLPTGSVYEMWIQSTGGLSSSCGNMSWTFSMNYSGCGLVSDYLDERTDLIVDSKPEYYIEPQVGSDGECDCPNISEG